MKQLIVVMLCAGTVALAGCGEKAPEMAAPATPAPAKAVGPKGSGVALSGSFRLVKLEDSASVFVIKDGKKSAIANWGWVEAHGAGKRVETITKTELDSYADSGMTYQ